MAADLRGQPAPLRLLRLLAASLGGVRPEWMAGRHKSLTFNNVFSNDGWWFGFISGIIEENYDVHFPTTGQEIAYPSISSRMV